jgi:hypothetical protein
MTVPRNRRVPGKGIATSRAGVLDRQRFQGVMAKDPRGQHGTHGLDDLPEDLFNLGRLDEGRTDEQ